MSKKHFHYFRNDVSHILLPNNFTFPFYYEPHDLCKIAAKEVQEYLISQTSIKHNFGLDKNNNTQSVGKMFGVLIIQNQKKEIGYLVAFSGKFSDNSFPDYFVPPIYDRYQKDGFFIEGEQKLNLLNQQIINLENNTVYKELQQIYKQKKEINEQELFQEKKRLKEAKNQRKSIKKKALKTLSNKNFLTLTKSLQQESYNQQFFLKELTAYRHLQLEQINKNILEFSLKITALKNQRKELSNFLQKQLFKKYQFLNIFKSKKGVLEIFEELSIQTPPAGSGDCAAPRLLQYAFLNNYRPIALAEFWWGTSPNSAIRKHQQFYPSCQSRCKPILSHMLLGMKIDVNPMLTHSLKEKKLSFLYEDAFLVIVNKPTEFLSVPGKEITDSVATRMKKKYPNATGPLVVHRLDMSTSGILIVAKTMEVYKLIQNQFINRTIKKRYVAILEGNLNKKTGIINLPLRVDFDDRPRQLVCYKHGKNAITKWKVINKTENRTRVYFYPITGRTHQLRVHASHHLGLNTPIVGDDLYGTKNNRLYLHADYIEFLHPISRKKIQFQVNADF